MTSSATHDPQCEPNPLPARIRTLRTQAGITIRNAATSANVSASAWKRWEAGTSTPLLDKAQRIANALGVPVLALFEANVVAEVVLSEAAVQAVRREGAPAAERYAQQVAASLAPLILATATPRRSPSGTTRRAKPRRSRAEVLAGIAQANAAREARTAPGPPEGQHATSSGGLPSASAEDQGLRGLSTLQAESVDE